MRSADCGMNPTRAVMLHRRNSAFGILPSAFNMPRVDQVLVERGLCESREKAKRAVMAGQVRVNGQVASKASDTIKDSDAVELIGAEKFVSRGGYKLEHALEHFRIDVRGLSAIDLGAS